MVAWLACGFAAPVVWLDVGMYEAAVRGAVTALR